MSKNRSEILPDPTEQDIEFVASLALQVIPAQPAISFHMANDRFNRIAPSQRPFPRTCARASLSTDEHLGLGRIDRMPAIPLIHDAPPCPLPVKHPTWSDRPISVWPSYGFPANAYMPATLIGLVSFVFR